MASSPEALQLAEIKRKAALGIALTGKSAANQTIYDQTRAGIDKEIARKAENGIALTSNSSDYNTKMYNDLVAAKNAANKPVVGTATTGTVGTGAGTGTGTSKSYIDGLAAARKNKALADLAKARDASLSNLGAEKATIQPKFYDAKNQTAAGSQQQARNFAEFMAARGGTNSGSNAQAELTRGMTLQGNLGALGQQEAQAYSDIARRTSDLQNAYQSDVASANAGIEADSMQSMLNDYYQQQQRELQIAELTGMLGGQQTLAGKSQQWGQTVDTANLTGIFNGQKTAQQAQQDWQNRFNFGNATGQFANGQQTLENKQFQYTQGRDKVADQQWQSEFDRIIKQDGVENALAWASQNLNERQEGRIAANQASSGSGNGGSSGKAEVNMNLPFNVSDMEKYIKTKIPGLSSTMAGPPSPQQLEDIENLILSNTNLSEKQWAQLYQKFGIQVPQ